MIDGHIDTSGMQRLADPAYADTTAHPVRTLTARSWACELRWDDPRLAAGGLLPPPDLDLAGQMALAEVAAGVLEQPADEVVSWARRILEWQRFYSLLPLDDAAQVLLESAGTQCPVGRRGNPLTQPWIDGLAERFGTTGQAPKTLDQVARRLGVTRERVRQVEKKVREQVRPFGELWLPQLHAALAVFGEQPRTTEEFAATLCERGITRNRFELSALTAIAELSGRSVELNGPEGLVGVSEGLYVAVTREVKSLFTSPGVGSVMLVGRTAAEALEQTDPVPTSVVRTIAGTLPALRWLDTAQTIFRSGTNNPSRVRLRNIAQVMLSVTDAPLPAATILNGLERKNGMRGRATLVDAAMVAAFFADHPDFEVVDGNVSSVVPLDWRQTVGPETRTMVEVLLSRPGRIGDRNSIIKECVERGMNATTVSMWLTFHEAIADYGWAVWGLVGAAPSPAAVRAIQDGVRAQFERAQIEDGWNADGQPWLCVRVTRSMLNTGVISVAWHQFMAGRKFGVLLEDGSSAGHISFGDDHHFVWGWNTALHALKVSHGQSIQATFDLPTNTVAVTAL